MTTNDLETYRQTVESVRAMLDDGVPLAAALRAEWRRLGSLTGRGGIIRSTRLAADLGANPATVADALKRERRRQRQAEPAAREPEQPPRPAEPESAAAAPAEKPTRTAPEKPKKTADQANRKMTIAEQMGGTRKPGETNEERARRERAELEARTGRIDGE